MKKTKIFSKLSMAMLTAMILIAPQIQAATPAKNIPQRGDNVSAVQKYLAGLDLSKDYSTLFAQQNVDGSVFVTMDKNDWTSLGVTEADAIKIMKQPNLSPGNSPGTGPPAAADKTKEQKIYEFLILDDNQHLTEIGDVKGAVKNSLFSENSFENDNLDFSLQSIAIYVLNDDNDDNKVENLKQILKQIINKEVFGSHHSWEKYDPSCMCKNCEKTVTLWCNNHSCQACSLCSFNKPCGTHAAQPATPETPVKPGPLELLQLSFANLLRK